MLTVFVLLLFSPPFVLFCFVLKTRCNIHSPTGEQLFSLTRAGIRLFLCDSNYLKYPDPQERQRTCIVIPGLGIWITLSLNCSNIWSYGSAKVQEWVIPCPRTDNTSLLSRCQSRCKTDAGNYCIVPNVLFQLLRDMKSGRRASLQGHRRK